MSRTKRTHTLTTYTHSQNVLKVSDFIPEKRVLPRFSQLREASQDFAEQVCVRGVCVCDGAGKLMLAQYF